MESRSITIEYEGDEFVFNVEVYSDVKQIHIYVKEIWWGVPNDAGPEEYIKSLERWAKRLEALLADGWEFVDSDGEHLYFEKQASQSSTSNSYQVTQRLE